MTGADLATGSGGGHAVLPLAVDGTYKRLRDAIVAGHYLPNQRLVEAELSASLGAGRTSIRAALVRLDQEGLVERTPNRGARVRLISDREALEIEEIRGWLEQLLARRAALYVRQEDLDDLRAIHAEMSRRVAANDPLGYSELNIRFHERIWAASGQEVACRLLANLKSQRIRFQYRTILQPGRPQGSLHEHEVVLQALLDRDPDAAEAAMRDHLSHVLNTLRDAIGRHHGGGPG